MTATLAPETGTTAPTFETVKEGTPEFRKMSANHEAVTAHLSRFIGVTSDTIIKEVVEFLMNEEKEKIPAIPFMKQVLKDSPDVTHEVPDSDMELFAKNVLIDTGNYHRL